MLLSICIPTYNRVKSLNNCLNSILIAKNFFNLDFEVCISDNATNENISNIINLYKKKFKINYHRNKKNYGVGYNILKAVSLAKGKYSWIIGNDDLLLPYTFKRLSKIFNKRNISFFYINSFNLESRFVFQFKQPFDTNLIPSNLEKVSHKKNDAYLNFFDLVNPKISFDCLMGTFLTIFDTQEWNKNVSIVNNSLLKKAGTFSSFENTCPHIIIFARSFAKHKTYFVSEPLSVNLSGLREWGNLWDFIEIVRIPEILDVYKKNGLPFYKYYFYKNFVLRNFLPRLLKIVFYKDKKNYKYISCFNHVIKSLLYPNAYLSAFFFLYRKFLKD